MKKRIIFTAITLILLVFMPVLAKQVDMDTSLNNNYLEAESKNLLYLKVGLTGFEIETDVDRPPINVAIVIDKSGSMQGDKIQKAKEAAILAVNMLGRNDILSVILYSDLVNVLVPATKVSDKENIIQNIRQIRADGSTAIFAGVSKGAQELRKFLDRNRVNRIILISDGLANVGPDTPGAFGDLGSSLIKEGISVTTIGLGAGYNEDLMASLAEKSDGNHAFAENSADLVRIFNYEFGDVLSVVAQEVVVKIKCEEGIRPVRVMGREADISGQTVYAHINQLYSKQEKYILLEMEIPGGTHNSAREVAVVDLSYLNMETRVVDKLSSTISVRFSDNPVVLEENLNKAVMADVVMQIATLNNIKAVELRDLGDIEGAKKVLESNSMLLKQSAEEFDSQDLFEYGELNLDASMALEEEEWNVQRKEMTQEQYRNKTQQSY